MGHYADSAVHHFMRSLGGSSRASRKRKGFQARSGDGSWRLGNGTIVKMSDMSDEHLRNAIRVASSKHPCKARQMKEVMRGRMNP